MGIKNIPVSRETVEGVLETNNTSTPLDADEVYTGQWVNVSYFASIVAAVSTDVDGTLEIQFSPDATNVDSTLTYSIDAGVVEAPHRLTVTRKWMRLKYTNGSAAQTYFRLQAMAGSQTALSAPLRSTLGLDADALAARVISEENDVVLGKRRGYQIIRKFGKNTTINTATVPEDIWEGGGVYTGFPTGAAEIVEFVSTSPNDTNVAGSGARTVLFQGLDADGNFQEEMVELNGTTVVDSAFTWTRINRGVVMTSGNSNQAFNAGVITAKHKVTTANVFVSMPVGVNQTQVSAYTIPANFNGIIKDYKVEMSKSTNATASGSIWIRKNGDSPRLIDPFTFSQSSRVFEAPYGGLLLEPLTDVVLRIDSVSTNGVNVTGVLEVLLVKLS